MSARFTDKIALITGGGSGIGRATAIAFAAEGATVVVVGRDIDALEHTAEMITAEGGQASALRADVTRGTDVAAMVETTVARHGGLHIAFNNAGMFTGGAIVDMDEDTWTAMLNVNLTGVWLSMKHEIAHMRHNGGGVIINTSSNLGMHLRPAGFGAYGATKAGVSVLTRITARECIGDGIRINAISPGPIATRMSLRPGETETDRAERLKTSLPIGRVGSLEEAAAAALWLASAESSFTVGHDLVLDGGASA